MKKKINNSKNSAKSQQVDQVDSVEMDEISYLLSNEVNKKRLLDAINELNHAVYYKHNLIEYQEYNT